VTVTEAPKGHAAAETVHIAPSCRTVELRLGDLWRYRELLFFLVWRDIKVRYKQTFLGALWAILQPFLAMVIFSVFLGHLAKVPSDGLPYPVFTYAALLPWQLFVYALTESGNSLVANQQLLTKVFFPRLVIPVAAVLAGLVDFAIAFVVLIAMMIYYGVAPTAAMLLLPLFVVALVLAALGTGLLLATLNVRYRDVRYAIPFLTQFWLFATPVAYSTSLIPKGWRAVYGLNPMAGVVDGFRWALLGTRPPGPLILVSAAVVFVGLLGGIAFFRQGAKTFADVV